MGHIDRALARAAQRAKQALEQRPPLVSELVQTQAKPIDLRALPYVRLDRDVMQANRLVIDEMEASGSSAYMMLRTRVLQRLRRNGWSTLAITGLSQGEGKTTTAINLSQALARDVNTSVILVDLDLRKPTIHRYLGVAPKFEFLDYLKPGAPLEKMLVSPDRDRFGLLLNQTVYPNSSEILASPQMGTLVANLRQGEGRIVVFDLPPLLVTDDMLSFSPLVDSLLLVVSEGLTKREDLGVAKEFLQDLNILGTVINRSSEDAPQYYSYYG